MKKFPGMSGEYWLEYVAEANGYAEVPQAERLERYNKAVRVIKALGRGAYTWRNDWYLHTLGWMEACADEVREAYEAERATQATQANT